jgi:hypothetical protein
MQHRFWVAAGLRTAPDILHGSRGKGSRATGDVGAQRGLTMHLNTSTKGQQVLFDRNADRVVDLGRCVWIPYRRTS